MRSIPWLNWVTAQTVSLRLLLGLLVGFPVGLLVGLVWLLWGEGCLHLEAVACLLEAGVPLWTLE